MGSYTLSEQLECSKMVVAAQQEMNSDIRTMDFGAPSAFWEILALRVLQCVTKFRAKGGWEREREPSVNYDFYSLLYFLFFTLCTGLIYCTII